VVEHVISRSVKQQSLLNAYWIPINFQNAAILTIAVPAALLHLAGSNHTTVLAILISVAGILSMIVPPIAGAISDHFRRRGGLRRPFILAGAAINVLGLLWLTQGYTIGAFAAALLVAMLGQAVSLAAYQPLIPEVVHRSEWGLASGYQGIATLVGTVLGLAFAGTLSPFTVFIWAAVFVMLGAVAAALTPERPSLDDHGDHAHIGSWPDFVIAFTSRMFHNFGFMLLTTFVLYFFNDVLHVPNPSATTSGFGALSLIGAIATSLWMGSLSDRVSRKLMVAAAGLPMAAAIFIFALLPGMHLILLIAILFGLGYGAFASTGWALAIDSVPQLRDAARDLGIWGLASGLPGIAAPAFGGWLLAQYTTPAAGYRMLFLVAAWCFVIGSFVVLFVGSRKGRLGVSLLTITAFLIYPYYWTVNRIRKWGRLPRKRGSTLVLCNHQYDLDTIAGPIALQIDGPWNGTIYSTGSRRMFEPGFLALRLSWVFSPLRMVRATKLFNAIGILPIENELRTRTLVRLAGTVYTQRGNIPIGEAFSDNTLTRLGIPASSGVKTVFTKQWFTLADETWIGIKTMREPFRSEIFAQTRANLEPDYQRFERILQEGKTLFLTPEGRHSKDGRLSPLRTIIRRLEPFADQIWLIAMSYDVFVGSRLSLLVHLVEPVDRNDLTTSMKAARPVVVSQLLASWMIGNGLQNFSADEAEYGVVAELAALPAGAFVDPELRRAPHEMTRRAIEGMRRLHMLIDSGPKYAVTAQRKHPKFVIVDDMIAYQANFFEETVSALRALAHSVVREEVPTA
jgi:MFS family permease